MTIKFLVLSFSSVANLPVRLSSYKWLPDEVPCVLAVQDSFQSQSYKRSLFVHQAGTESIEEE